MKFDQYTGYTRDTDNPHQDDRDHPNKGVMVEFYEKFQPRLDMRGKEIKGADGKVEMFGPFLMMKFHTVGDPKTLAARKATDEDKYEWKGAYELFLKGQDFTKQAGTPLESLPGLDMMNRVRLQALGIFSIEQLSDTPENIILQNPDVRNFVNMAREYRLKNRPKPNQDILDEMAALRAEVANLKAAKVAPKSKSEGIAA